MVAMETEKPGEYSKTFEISSVLTFKKSSTSFFIIKILLSQWL